MTESCPTAFDTAHAVRSKALSAEAAVQLSLDRIQKLDSKLKALLSYDAERALTRARQIDADVRANRPPGPLTGVPIVLKDNICTAHGATTCASKILENYRAPYDATVVRRLEGAGAIILGKANLDEFAMGSSTENSAFFSTRNPWNLDCVAGGSSGGSAAAVAAGLVPAALGSDTGGSIRQPASFCGVIGLKPTYGRVSRFGLVAFGSSLDQIGPLAADARDAALILGVIAGHDPRDSTSADVPVPDYLAALERPLAGLRIGVCDADFAQGLDREVEAAVRAALHLLQKRGATLVPVQLPRMKYAVACYYLIAMAEASSNLARYDGVRYGFRAPSPSDIADLYAATRGIGFGDEVKRRIILGTFALSSGYYDAYYLKALKVRTLLKQDLENALDSADILASPVTPTTAFRFGEKSQDPMAMYLSDVYTIAANLAGLPAISVPCGFDSKNLPVGIQFTARAFAEPLLLSVAHQYQKCTDWRRLAPQLA